MNLTTFQKFNPVRTPAWRADRVTELLSSDPPRRATRGDDTYVRQFRRFRMLMQGATELQKSRVWQMNPALYYAHMLHLHADIDVRRQLQSRLLAGQSDAEVAVHAATVAEAVDWYEKLFFNVRDRLGARDWVHRCVLCPAYMSGGDYMTGLLLLYGFYGGPVMVDFMTSFLTPGSAKPRGGEQARDFAEQHFKDTVCGRSAATSQWVDINRYNAMELFNVHLKLMEIEQRADEAGQTQSTLERGLLSALKALPWDLAEQRTQLLEILPPESPRSRVLQIKTRGAEITDNEMMLIAAGVHPETLDDKVLNLQLPEHREDRDAKS